MISDKTLDTAVYALLVQANHARRAAQLTKYGETDNYVDLLDALNELMGYRQRIGTPCDTE